MKAFLTRVRRRTWFILASAVVALGVGGSLAWLLWLQPASSADAAPRTQTSAASLETLEKTVEATGTLAPSVQDDVSFEASGTVTSVLVAPGDTVAAGQTLATIDTLSLDAARLQAIAQLASAKSQLSSATTSAAIAAQTAAVAVAQSAVDEATAAMSEATLTAPVAGLVTSVGVAVGDVVGSSSGSSGAGAGGATGAASTTATASTAAFSIVGTDSWGVSLSVGETDMALITTGDQVELATDEGTALFGVVGEIGLLPSTSSGAVTYPVEVAITGDTTGLFDGVSVTADIVYERRTDVLTVPSAAVTTADGVSTVTVVASDGTQSTKTVTVGETVDNLTEIADGIAEGDEVVVVVFTGGAGNQGTTGTQQGGFPDGGTPPDGFDPTQGGQGGFGGTGGTGQQGGQQQGGGTNG